jgi:hypothetical protein
LRDCLTQHRAAIAAVPITTGVAALVASQEDVG